MLLLKRLTLDYSVEEDRMKLTGLTHEGELIIAWLTHRLLGRVVPHLLTRCKASANLLGQNSGLLKTSEPLKKSEGSESPVLSASGTPAFLVVVADITQEADSIALTLRGDADELRFIIPVEKMAHWLSGLKNLYQVAEWSMTIWQGADQILMPSEVGGSVTLH